MKLTFNSEDHLMYRGCRHLELVLELVLRLEAPIELSVCVYGRT